MSWWSKKPEPTPPPPPALRAPMPCHMCGESIDGWGIAIAKRTDTGIKFTIVHQRHILDGQRP